jgi:hypothetical protein
VGDRECRMIIALAFHKCRAKMRKSQAGRDIYTARPTRSYQRGSRERRHTLVFMDGIDIWVGGFGYRIDVAFTGTSRLLRNPTC